MRLQTLAGLVLTLTVVFPTVVKADNLEVQAGSVEIRRDGTGRTHIDTGNVSITSSPQHPEMRHRTLTRRYPQWMQNLFDRLQRSPSSGQTVQRIHCNGNVKQRQQITQTTRSGQSTIQTSVSTTCS